MIRNKFRLRINDCRLSEEISDYMSSNKESFSKHIFRINRVEFLREIQKRKIVLPVRYDNIVYVANSLFVKDSWVESVTPQPIIDMAAL